MKYIANTQHQSTNSGVFPATVDSAKSPKADRFPRSYSLPDCCHRRGSPNASIMIAPNSDQDTWLETFSGRAARARLQGGFPLDSQSSARLLYSTCGSACSTVETLGRSTLGRLWPIHPIRSLNVPLSCRKRFEFSGSVRSVVHGGRFEQLESGLGLWGGVARFRGGLNLKPVHFGRCKIREECNRWMTSRPLISSIPIRRSYGRTSSWSLAARGSSVNLSPAKPLGSSTSWRSLADLRYASRR